MIHLWVRAEQRPFEERVGLMPEGAAQLIAQGFRLTVEQSAHRCIPITAYAEAGCDIADQNSWPEAPEDAWIFGLKELPEDGTPLRHRHIMFGHAFKGQPAGRILLKRFRAGGGTLFDLEYLLDETGRRVAAFGYWAGFAGAAVSLACWASQMRGGIMGPLQRPASKDAMLKALVGDLDGTGRPRPRALVIGALGRVGTGATDLCTALGVPVTRWDTAETASGGPFPEILDHDIFLNCILAGPGCPVFVAADAGRQSRKLRVIGDIACDPGSDFSPIKVYDRVTDWERPARRVQDQPPLDVMAIDNLPSLLPVESSADYAAQLLPTLQALRASEQGVWARARAEFDRQIATCP
ncbi:saccharopine dehydrogenase [Plastorhodobacter daqingensis]|uniref:Saccharopine dehydrogenase [NAD(+), L-lysine-forming] n=1 Tax=Plastorhodobacter daqingensis TaxID=1387281 RepID=A0ABW2UQB6_9RHOB